MREGHKTLIVTDSDSGHRLDSYLAKEHAAPSRSFIQKLVKDGHVLVEGRIEKPSYRVQTGNVIEVSVPAPVADDVMPEDIPLEIVYEDEYLLVVNKSSGMVVHPAPGARSGTLVSALLSRSGSLSSIGGVMRPGIVHRLDKDTSGLMIVAKTDAAHLKLAADLGRHIIKRRYVAIVRGNIREDRGIIDACIGRHPRDRKKQAVREDGRAAVTHFQVDERLGSHTLVRLELETGRTHQIRVHMAFIGHPVAGDPVYSRGGGELGLTGQALHAEKLGFDHPISGMHMEFHSDMPDAMRQALETLRSRMGRDGRDD